MIDFNKVDVDVPITKEEILAYVSIYDIFKKYCHNFEDLDKSFCSNLRRDKNPSCRIFVTRNNELKYKDFATGDCFSWVEYIQHKYACKFYEALNIVANDFNLRRLKTEHPEVLLGMEPILPKLQPKTKTNLIIGSQPWNIVDYEFWSKFNISFEVLNNYDVFSCKRVQMLKGDKRYIFEATKTSPIYAYRFTYDGVYSYKIYRPYEEPRSKWLFNGVKDNIEGFDQLDLHGDLLILTKAMKDVMCYRSLGYNAIAMQGEANIPTQELIDKLSNRFTQILVNLDNDAQGIISTNRIVDLYGLKHFYIDEAKDLSDLIKLNGVEYGRNQITRKVSSCKI